MRYSLSLFLFLSSSLFSISIPAQEYLQKKNGKFKENYANGTIKTSGEIKNHYKSGEWKTFTNEGILKTIYVYKEGKFNGPFQIYAHNGKLEKEGTYKNGIITGEVRVYYPNEQLRSITNYNEEGKRIGLQQYWNNNGAVIEANFFGADSSKRIFTYSGTGNLTARKYSLNNKKEGPQYFYSTIPSNIPSDTFPNSIESYHKGLKEGAWLRYGSNHALQSESYYKNDKLDSVAREWNPDGTQRYEFHYKEGQFHGHCVNFEKGKLFAEGNYENGKLEGMHTQYQPELCYSWFKNQEMDSCRCFYEGKTLRLHYSMLDPKENIQRCIEYDTLGKKSKEWLIQSNVRNGIEKYYDLNGKGKSSVNYKNGKANDVLKAWSLNGKLVLHAPLDSFGGSSQQNVWSDTGVKLKKGTPAFTEQIRKYLPNDFHYDETSGSIYGEWIEEPIEEIIEERPNEESEQVLTFAEEMPAFPDFQRFLSLNIKYPVLERENGKQGTVYVKFIVEKDGAIAHVQIAKGVPGAPGFEKEALRVFSMMPNWKPGKMNGRPVRVEMTQPVRFSLQQ